MTATMTRDEIQTEIRAICETAVSQGIVYLDETYGDWRPRIDRQRLDIADPFDCILGQLEGYCVGVNRLFEHGGRLASEIGCAFPNLPRSLQPKEFPTVFPYQILNEVWLEHLSEVAA